MQCSEPGCSKPVDRQGLCFRHRVSGVGFAFAGSAQKGRAGWNRTANEWRMEHLGTADEKELAKRGIERA